VLYNSEGKECLTQKISFNGNRKIIPVKNFGNGIYVVKLLSENQKTFISQKISLFY
jgi:hypothetical protein